MSTTRIAFPYPRAPRASVLAPPWRVVVGGAEQMLAETLKDWDPATPIRFLRDVHVDVDALAAVCNLGQGARLMLATTWRSNTTGLRRVLCSAEFGLTRGSVTVHCNAIVAPYELGGTLDLRTRLVFGSGELARRPGPVRPGSVLWSEAVKVVLEGDAARFPVEVIDFEATNRFAAGAPWALVLALDDLDAPATNAVRLYLNSGHALAVAALTPGDLASPGGLVEAMLNFDVARALVNRALDSDAIRNSDADSFEEESIGRTLAALVRVLWPDESAPALRRSRENDPDRFETELKHRLRFLSAR